MDNEIKQIEVKYFKWLTIEELISAFIIFVIGIVIYYQMAVDWLTNPDTVWNALYVRVGHGSEKNGGRILQIVIDWLRGGVVTPVLMLAISLIILTLISLIISRLFELEHDIISQVIIGFLVLFVPCTSSALTFYYCSDSFQLSFLCVILGIYLIHRYDTYKSNIIALILFTASLFFYQAYICIVFTVCAFWLVLDSVRKQFRSSIKEVIRLGSLGAISCVMYAVLFKIFRIIFHIEIQDRMGVDTSFSINGVIASVGKALSKFWDYFFTNNLYHNDFGYRNIINICIWIIVFIMLAYGIVINIDDKKYQRLISVLAGILILPMATTAIVVMAPKIEATVTMLPTMEFIYILPLILSKEILKTENIKKFDIIKKMTYIIIALLIWNFLIFTNLCISSMKMRLNKTESVATLMLNQIVETVGYNSDYKLLVSGAMEDGNFPDVYADKLSLVDGTYAEYGYMWHNFYANEECWINFLKQYRGIGFQSCSTEEYEEFLNSDIYEQMPIFPESGSVVQWNGMVVVKMSDVKLD